ncbi:MAG: HDOD domain-containing protein [bacterium]|nr:HDOD domain-containing protein [bacterium]
MSVDRVKARIMTVMRNLPPLPEVTRQLMAVMGNEDSSAADVAKVLSGDQALAGKVLKIANSSFYGVPNEVTTISRAVVIMGFTGVRNMALGLGTTSALREMSSKLDMNSFWSHAMANAAAAQVLAPHMQRRMDPEEAFLAGLMHDIGAYVLAAAVPDAYAEAHVGEEGSILERERNHVGFTHTQIGQGLLQFWQLPDPFGEAARFHHDADKASSGDQPLTNLVALADILACIHDGSFEAPAGESDLGRLMMAAGISTDNMMAAIAGMSAKIDDMQEFMHIAGAAGASKVESAEFGAGCVVVTTDEQRRQWTEGVLKSFGYELCPMDSYFNGGAGSEGVRLAMVDPQTLTREQTARLMPFLSSQPVQVCVMTDSETPPPQHLAEYSHLNFIFTRRQLNALLEETFV